MTSCHVRFMDNNLALPAAARITASSALAGFPASNGYNQIRSKVWKPAGNFQVTSSNNKIYVYDSGGPFITVTLTNAYYNYLTLAAHVQTKLNASSSNWTCSYNTTTSRFVIGRSSGVKVLAFSERSNAAWDMLGYTSSGDQTAGTADQSRNHTDEWYKVDLVAALAVQAFMVCGPVGIPFPISDSATILLQASNIDEWDDPPLEIDLTRFDRGIFQFTDDAIDDVTYRYWRFQFIDRTNPVGPEGFYFGYFYFGSYTTVLTSNVAPGFGKKLVDPTIVSSTESGAEFFERLEKYRSFDSFEIQNLEGDERRELEQLFYEIGIDNYFFFCLDPSGEVTADLDEATFYGRFNGEPSLRSIIRDLYTVQFSCREVV